MFQAFMTLLLGLIPFLKELILGNQTLRQALLNNKFAVAMGLIFLILFGAFLYMKDVATAAQVQITALEAKLHAPTPKCTPPVVVPPVVSNPSIDIPTQANPVVTPPLKEPVDNEGSKDAKIRQLEDQVKALQSGSAKHKRHGSVITSPAYDPLDRLYRNYPPRPEIPTPSSMH